MRTSLKIGTIMGIPIKLHITFLLILPVFALVFATNPAPFGFADVPSLGMNYALSLLTTILLFACILLHELGHSYFAKKYGVTIKDITLLLFGGVSSMEEIPRDPSQEFKMALAGPLVSFIIGFALLAMNSIIDSSISGYSDGLIYRMFLILGSINIVLGAFNLLPAFPMDGGRLLRAWYAKRMSYIKATHYAAYFGKMFAFIMGIFGLLANPWLLLIAFFVYIGASEEDKSTTVTVLLERYTVKDIMSDKVVSVSDDISVEELSKFMFENKHMGYPVMKGNSLKGIVTFTDIRNILPHERFAVLVSDVMTRDIISVSSKDVASEAFKVMTLNNIGRVLVIDDGELVGILSRTDLMRTLMLLNE
ncbi:CBS domain-containing protein [Methanolobus sp. ZRKC3]|uniref:CBS domain-containing protein n=1 Tax=Methanolobus sp. ZRKC3 TaxID=3125786 RepID=UPI00324C7B70